MSQQSNIDPRIKFYHVMNPDGSDGITIGYRQTDNEIEFSIFEQNGYPRKGYNKRIGREATAGRLAKGKYQELFVPEGGIIILHILQAAFNFWLARNKSPLDMMYVRGLFKIHYDRLSANTAALQEEVPSVLH